jgi:flavin-dependent dehydrogenase
VSEQNLNQKNAELTDASALKVVILGGGTAGWMTANLMARAWPRHDVEITLVESPAIGVIGVGEGSTPHLKSFFDKIDVNENQWMPACNATYKNGIRFKNWSTKPGFNSYFHPFTSLIDAHTAPAFTYNSIFKRRGFEVDSHPDRFFLSTALATNQQVPIGDYNFPFDISYGYHFDAVLLGQFLAKIAKLKGVKRIQATVEKVNLAKSGENNGGAEFGDIKTLELDNGQSVSGDLFIDCSGFKSVLLQETLQVPFISFADNLFNDSAVTIAIPHEKSVTKINSQTISTAMKYGWAWDIPLTNRTGNGYVYSSTYCSKEEAENELRIKLGVSCEGIAARHLKMKVGRVEKHWHQNCVAIGLSQGFIEPLEATALHFVQETIEQLIENLNRNHFTRAEQRHFNEKINARFEGIRDYIVAHYRLSSREDSQYWRDNSENPNISNNLKRIVTAWVKGDDLNKALTQNDIESFYPPISWHAMLAGYGIFPPITQINNENSAAHKYDLAHIDQFIERSRSNFQDHYYYLKKRECANDK